MTFRSTSVEAEIQRAESADFEGVDAPSSDSARVIQNDVLGFGRCAQVHLRAMGRRGARGVQSSDWLSGGHLEAGRPVPTACAHGRFMLCCKCRRRSRPSVDDIGRRRSVRCGGLAMHMHARICTDRIHFDSCIRALLCFRVCMIGARCLFVASWLKLRLNDSLKSFPRARARAHLLFTLRGSGAEV